MVEKQQIYQTVTLVIIILIFDTLERRRPGHAVERRRDLPLNLLALAVTAAAGEMWKPLLTKGFNSVELGAVLSMSHIQRLPGAAKIILGLILADFFLYWVHRAMHRNGSLLLPTTTGFTTGQGVFRTKTSDSF